MTSKTKGRTGWHIATPKTSKFTYNFTGFVPNIKVVIVTLALWGWLSVEIAGWLIKHGEQHDD